MMVYHLCSGLTTPSCEVEEPTEGPGDLPGLKIVRPVVYPA